MLYGVSKACHHLSVIAWANGCPTGMASFPQGNRIHYLIWCLFWRPVEIEARTQALSVNCSRVYVTLPHSARWGLARSVNSNSIYAAVSNSRPKAGSGPLPEMQGSATRRTGKSSREMAGNEQQYQDVRARQERLQSNNLSFSQDSNIGHVLVRADVISRTAIDYHRFIPVNGYSCAKPVR